MQSTDVILEAAITTPASHAHGSEERLSICKFGRDYSGWSTPYYIVPAVVNAAGPSTRHSETPLKQHVITWRLTQTAPHVAFVRRDPLPFAGLQRYDMAIAFVLI